MPQPNSELELLAAMSPAQLRAEWRRVNRSTAPEVMSPDLLRRGIAYRLQEKANGGLPGDISRRLERLAKQLAKTGDLEIAKDISLKPGTRLMREWHGKVYQVTVTDDGYLFEDRRYISLSQIAQAITGAIWSGPRFFGLKRRTTFRPKHG